MGENLGYRPEGGCASQVTPSHTLSALSLPAGFALAVSRIASLPAGSSGPALVRGRIAGVRSHGRVSFADLRDESGELQLKMVDAAGCSFPPLKVGDIVTARGAVVQNRRRQLVLEADAVALVAHCQNPFPDRRHGLQDRDLRFGSGRVADLLVNRSSFQFLRSSSLYCSALRQGLTSLGYLEFDTGILQERFDAGLAKPFMTTVNASGRTHFLRLTSEIRLKELIISGFEKVFELGKSFRNEGVSSIYSPEFTLLEFYAAYETSAGMKDLTAALISRATEAATGSVILRTPGRKEFDTSKPWPEISFDEAVREFTPFRLPGGLAPESVREAVRDAPGFSKDMVHRQVLERIIDKHIAPHLEQPTFLTRLPAAMSPLVAHCPDNPALSDRAWLMMDGLLVADVYQDLNDPERLSAELSAQSAITGREPNQDFVNNLRWGIPPTAGVGMGINRLLLSIRPEGMPADIRETMLYPIRKR